jgi:hypothetical protein
MGKLRGPRSPLLLIVSAAWLAACAGVKQKAAGTDAAVTATGGSGPGISGTGGSGTTGSGGSSATGGAIGTDAGASDAACVPTVTTCTQPGGTYCGKIGNGCPGGSVDCGACQTGYTCTNGICIGGASCPTIACGNYCGSIGDGCGRTLTCGSCSASNQCNSGICASPGCVPLTCNPATGTRYCGSIGDGCGGTLDCGSCPGGVACGSGGVPNLCTDPSCKPVTCTPTGGQYCGTIGDGCGGILNCGTCANGMTCGGSGTPSVCPGATSTGGCTGLQCQVATCTGTVTTSVSGIVYDPAGKVPLYNVTVYVPNAPLASIPEGVSCDKCSAQVSGQPIAAALTDATGAFHLTGVPSGTNIPLVMQVGKWRRQVTIPTVTSCVDNKLTDVNLTRLPRTQSEGHMPKIAVTTGGSDAIECFLREMGIADSEFTTDAGSGRVNLYVGGDGPGNGQGTASFSAALGGATFPDAKTLWSNADKLLGYDILMHSCEGGQYPNAKTPYINNIKRYADSGGRLFNSHLHYFWLRNGPSPWPTTAVYQSPTKDLPDPATGLIDTTFPKGAALGQWLVNTGATPTAGSIQLYSSQHSVLSTTPPTSQQWVSIPATGSVQKSVQYLTINTPVEATAANQCGRVVVTDIHVKNAPPPGGGSSDDSDPKYQFPGGCKATGLSGQAKAMEFLFFDLSACIQPDTSMPEPPVVPPPGAPTSPPPSVSQPPPVPPPPPPPPPIVIDKP